MDVIPKTGSKWRHHTGIEYKVLMVANKANPNGNYPITVIYKGSNGNIWGKSLYNFLRKMKEI